MEAVFGAVLFAVVILAAIVAVFTFATSGDAYRQIGKGGLSLGDGSDRPPGAPRPGSAAATAEQQAEVRRRLDEFT